MQHGCSHLLTSGTARTDMSTYSKEALRTPGHLTERLFNIWRMHMLRTEGKNWKVKELQCIHFTNPEPRQKFIPLFEEKLEIASQNVVPVVFAADNNYVPILTCAMGSMLENADPNRYYDVDVLNTKIGGSTQELV